MVYFVIWVICLITAVIYIAKHTRSSIVIYGGGFIASLFVLAIVAIVQTIFQNGINIESDSNELTQERVQKIVDEAHAEQEAKRQADLKKKLEETREKVKLASERNLSELADEKVYRNVIIEAADILEDEGIYPEPNNWGLIRDSSFKRWNRTPHGQRIYAAMNWVDLYIREHSIDLSSIANLSESKTFSILAKELVKCLNKIGESPSKLNEFPRDWQSFCLVSIEKL